MVACIQYRCSLYAEYAVCVGHQLPGGGAPSQLHKKKKKKVTRQSFTAVKPAATPKCMVNLAAALFCCARIYSALRRSSAGLSPVFTKPFFFFFTA